MINGGVRELNKRREARAKPKIRYYYLNRANNLDKIELILATIYKPELETDCRGIRADGSL